MNYNHNDRKTISVKLFDMGPYFRILCVFCIVHLAACNGSVWNDPYPAGEGQENILYTSFSERPKHLDPVQSYSENEYAFIANIYQPPLQYHYLKRPYSLIAFGAEEVPQPIYRDTQGRMLPANAPTSQVAYSDYVIKIKKGLMYQPHPALAVDSLGKVKFHHLTAADIAAVRTLADFKETGSREVTAADYVHQIKRLAHPKLHSPVLQLMSAYIVGLSDLVSDLGKASKSSPDDQFVDLERYSIEGAQVIDRYTYVIRVHGKYPQFIYWLAMPFFSPVPPEADRFYGQAGLSKKNISLDWYPLGSGPYMLTVNNPNRKMILERNPHYSRETYPTEGMPGDQEAGLLRDAGVLLPLIDKVVFSLEKEQIPYWNKFLQGFYDASGIASDTFDQAVQSSGTGDVGLTANMLERGIHLQTALATSISYLGFNMLDPLIGVGERARLIRRAISIALDYEEYISIFRNGRGMSAHGPIPPGIFGYEAVGKSGINQYVYELVQGEPVRRDIQEAKRLLAEAGYPEGRDLKTGLPLLLNLDASATGADSKARMDWYVNQLSKLGIQLVIRSTDFNRLQDKLRRGTAQLYFLGWNGDYPDPENFLFLLYGPQSRVKNQGENASNYSNAEYDRLFNKMQHMANDHERQLIINRMLEILRYDAPWVWGFFPKEYTLHHAWVSNRQPNQMANNSLKYQRIDWRLRAKQRALWNQPLFGPLVILLALSVIAIIPAYITLRRREKRSAIDRGSQ